MWEWILAGALGTPREQPAWASSYALTRFTVSGPTLAAWFDGYNQPRPREEWIRPGSFGLIAHPDPAFYADKQNQVLPTAPYESRPERWKDLGWYDRATGKPITVITAPERDDPERFSDAVQSGAIVIGTLAGVLGRYTRRPEHKSLGPDGHAAAGRTHGLLRRRPISSRPADTLLTGKEGNKIVERLTGQVAELGDYRTDYGSRVEIWDLILPVLQDLGAEAIINSDIPRSTAFSTLKGVPPTKHRQAYLTLARNHATTSLERWGVKVPSTTTARLTTYLRSRDEHLGDPRRCEWCGKPLPPGMRSDARYDSAACRKAALRAHG